MRSIIIMFLLLSLTSQSQENVNYKGVIKRFYHYLYFDQVSIKEFSSVYANATLHFDTYLKLKDSLGLIYPTWKEIEDRNVNIDESVTNSYVFQKIKLEFDSLTYNLSLDQINEVIDNYTISSQGLKYAKIAELSFQENKKVYFSISNDLPERILWIWLNNAELLDDIINGESSPGKLYLVGTVRPDLSFTQVRNKPSCDGDIVEALSSKDHYYYIPNNYSDWCEVFLKEDRKTFLGYIQKTSIVPYDRMSVEQKKEVLAERNP